MPASALTTVDKMAEHFATRTAGSNLSKLSVWWLRLVISIERVEPGNLQ
jgi:hypothetical protein